MAQPTRPDEPGPDQPGPGDTDRAQPGAAPAFGVPGGLQGELRGTGRGQATDGAAAETGFPQDGRTPNLGPQKPGAPNRGAQNQSASGTHAPGAGRQAGGGPKLGTPKIGAPVQGRPADPHRATGRVPEASGTAGGAPPRTFAAGASAVSGGPEAKAATPEFASPDPVNPQTQDHATPRPLATAGLANLPDAVLPTPSPRPRGRIAPEWLAGFVTALWLAGVALFLWRADLSALGGLEVGMLTGAGVFPLVLIWLAVSVLRAARAVQDDASRLRIAVDAMRQAWLAQQQAAGIGLKPGLEQKLDDIAQAQKQTETALAMFTSSRVTQPDRAVRPGTHPGGSQPLDTAVQSALALDTPTGIDHPPLSAAEFIRALHFPETAEDTEGFAALRRALDDHATAQLVRAAQEVLTVLAQEGIYMDDLRPDRARPEVWRAFASGARGAAVAGLGGIRDRSCLALTVGRMRGDPVFRDTAHRFLREFDRCFTVFEAGADDADLARFAETRSARAFMLLGRVTGMFSARG